MNVGFISLGCDKNRVDAEKMLCRLSEAGYEIVPDKEEADVLLINTCAFIEAAKREAIDAIMDAIELKKRKIIKKRGSRESFDETIIKKYDFIEESPSCLFLMAFLCFLNILS